MTAHMTPNQDYVPFDSIEGWDNADTTLQEEPITCVTFDLQGQVFAVDVTHVREILDMQRINPLPNATADLLGMIDVRGEGIAIVDIASRLGVHARHDREDGRIIVLELGQSEAAVPVGVIADRVLNVVEIAPSDIEPAPRTMVRWEGDVVRGVARLSGEIVMLLSLPSVFGVAAKDPFDFS